MTRTILLTLALLSSGCATMINGRTQQVVIDSNVPGAAVEASTGATGRAPAHLVLTRAQRIQVEVSAEGYDGRTVVLPSTLDPITLASCLFWPALVVDVVSGAAMAYPAYTRVDLEPTAARAGPESASWRPAPVRRGAREPGLLTPMEPAAVPPPPLVRVPGGEVERGDAPAPLE